MHPSSPSKVIEMTPVEGTMLAPVVNCRKRSSSEKKRMIMIRIMLGSKFTLNLKSSMMLYAYYAVLVLTSFNNAKTKTA